MKTQLASPSGLRSAHRLRRLSDAEEIRAIAKDAFLYGFPLVDNFATLYAQAVNRDGPDYKAPFNRIAHFTRVATPNDTAVITPNSDTPYSFIWMDLRAEPLVLHVPAIEAPRYFSVQLVDLYTHNFAYLGTRATGRDAGTYLIAGPGWQGEKPAGVDAVIACETQIAYALYRTQLFHPEDMGNVKQLQQNYRVEPLSSFLKTFRPAVLPAIDWPKPSAGMLKNSSLFRYLNVLLAFAPTDASETDLMARFARIGVGPELPFDENALNPELKNAFEQGIADAWQTFAVFKKSSVDTQTIGSDEMFGTRADLKNNYLVRFAGAKLGLYGNSREEAIYNGYFVDEESRPLDASAQAYTLRFEKGALPPTQAFWSLTMYDGKTQLLVENPLKRYLLNSPMVESFHFDADGGVTFFIQAESPGKEKEANWLPAPKGPFYIVLRNYLPKPDVLSRQWKPPMVRRQRGDASSASQS